MTTRAREDVRVNGDTNGEDVSILSFASLLLILSISI